MSDVDRLLTELAGELQVRGRARRRFLRECRDHLHDSAEAHGERHAALAFGPAAQVAAAFDAEVLAHRGLRSTFATLAAVLATGASTLALIHASAPGAPAGAAWAIVFFVAAQIAAVALGLALLQALSLRRSSMSPPDLRLLARRNGCALIAAGATMFAAGAALPGRGSATLLLAGPTLACTALVAVARAWLLARRLDRSRGAAQRPPSVELDQLLPFRLPWIAPLPLLLVSASLAGAAAFVRDQAEHGTLGESLITAAVETTAVLAGALVLGRLLGLWPQRLAGPAPED